MATIFQTISSVITTCKDLIEACKVVRATYKGTQNFDKILDTATLEVEIELYRLRMWGEVLTSDSYKPGFGLSEIIDAILSQVKVQLDDLEEFLNPYIPSNDAGLATALRARRTGTEQPSGASQHRVTLISRVKFVIADQEKLADYQRNLKTKVDHLYSLVDSRRLELTLQSSLLQTDSINELETLVQATERSSNRGISYTAKTRAIRIRHLNSDWVALKLDHERLHCKRTSLTLSTSWESKSIGVLGEQRVLVEWKAYSPNLSLQESELRVAEIANLLHATNSSRPDDLKVPLCIGYIRGSATSGADKAAGIIYSIPASFPPVPAKPENLYDLLCQRTSGADGQQRPPLEARKALACALARALYHLHGANWLHKGLRSSNVIFFPYESSTFSPSESTLIATLSKPQLIGFDYARPDSENQKSEETDVAHNIYRHPSAQGAPRERFTPAFDLFALGIILLEIGIWVPMQELHSRYKRDKGLADDAATKLLHSHLQDPQRGRGVVKDLPFMMSTKYFEAVRSCLLVQPETYNSRTFIDIIGKLETLP